MHPKNEVCGKGKKCKTSNNLGEVWTEKKAKQTYARAAMTLCDLHRGQGCSNRTFFGVSAQVFRSLKTDVQLNKKSAA